MFFGNIFLTFHMYVFICNWPKFIHHTREQVGAVVPKSKYNFQYQQSTDMNILFIFSLQSMIWSHVKILESHPSAPERVYSME